MISNDYSNTSTDNIIQLIILALIILGLIIALLKSQGFKTYLNKRYKRKYLKHIRLQTKTMTNAMLQAKRDHERSKSYYKKW